MRLVHLPYGTYDGFVFESLGKNTIFNGELSPEDVLVLWGGEDISTSLYKQKNVASYSDVPSKRDLYEWGAMNVAKKVGAKILGICRGAQLACVFNGGSLWQDVQHPSYHELLFKDGKTVKSNSLHHQMMDLRSLSEGQDYELIAKTERLSPRFVNDKGTYKFQEEPEIVFFNKTKTLCVQGHPEFMPNSKFTTIVKDLIMEKLV